MAETVYTSDGKVHVLIRDHGFADLIREYMGPDAERAFHEILENIKENENE